MNKAHRRIPRYFFMLLLQDIRFELRHGMYTVYAVVCGMYLLILLSLSGTLREIITPILVFSDPVVLGFFFMGGMILLERRQDVLSGLFVTPVTPGTYVLSKALSLALLSLISALLIVLPIFGPAVEFVPFVGGVFLTSLLVGMLSIPFAVGAESLNEYFLSSGLAMMVFVPPIVEFFLDTGLPVFWILPTHSTLVLISGAIVGLSTGSSVTALSILALWSAAAWFWAVRSVDDYIHRRRRRLL